MATTTTWTGASSSAWDTAGNWSNGVPNTDSTAIIDGAVDITGGLPTNEEVERVFVAYTYTGAIGSSGTPLRLDCAQFSYDSNTLSEIAYVHIIGVENTTPDILIDGLKTGSAIVISGVLNRLSIETTFAGQLTLGNSGTYKAIPKDMYMLSSTGSVTAPVSADIDWASSGTIHIAGGLVTIAENFGASANVILSGGTLNVTSWTLTTGDSLTVLGGSCTWNAGANQFTSTAQNTIRTVNVISGSFSMASNAYGHVEFENMYQWGGTINLESSYANVIFKGTYERFAGTSILPKQSSIATAPL
tara:strand:- start:128 stop:1036 length:909 start_codon:yes stop_codon:yes gene_type:complete